VLRRGLGQHGIELLGCIPYSELLANPSLELIATHLDGELLAGEATPGRTVAHVAIGAMRPEHAIELIRDRTLLITPGDRDDLIAMALQLNAAGGGGQVTGLVLTGGFAPTDAVLADLRAADLFAYLVQTDTYRTAQTVDEIIVKTHPTDTDKIETIIQLVSGAIDVEGFLAHL
jgi:phosphate acetyltransferase